MLGFIIILIILLYVAWWFYARHVEVENATRNIVDNIYQDISPFEMHDKIFSNSPPLTDLQRETLWQQLYKNKTVKWTCRISNISSWGDNKIFVEGYAEYFKTKDGNNNQYYHLRFTLDSHDKDRLLKLNLGDKILVSGALPKDCLFWINRELNLENVTIV